MKFFSILLTLILSLLVSSVAVNAMWARMSNEQLVEMSDVILIAELTGRKQIVSDQVELTVGILTVGEVLKGSKDKTEFLLALPATDGLRKSDDIFYKNGQKGLWFLRRQSTGNGPAIYLADHPQRFQSGNEGEVKIEVIRKILLSKTQI